MTSFKGQVYYKVAFLLLANLLCPAVQQVMCFHNSDMDSNIEGTATSIYM